MLIVFALKLGLLLACVCDRKSTNWSKQVHSYRITLSEKNIENKEASQRLRRIILLIIAVTVHNIPGREDFSIT